MKLGYSPLHTILKRLAVHMRPLIPRSVVIGTLWSVMSASQTQPLMLTGLFNLNYRKMASSYGCQILDVSTVCAYALDRQFRFR